LEVAIFNSFMVLFRMAFSYHTHTSFCDGKADARTMASAAFACHYSHLGFSAHAPVPFKTNWNMPWEKAQAYIASIRELEREYASKGMKIFLGLETDYAPGITMPDAPEYDVFDLDYRIGSVHYITAPGEDFFTVDEPQEQFSSKVKRWAPDGDYRKIWKRYWRYMFEMIERGGFDIIGHFDLVKKNNADGRWFDESDPSYLDAAFQAVNIAARKGSIAEINTGGVARGKHREPYPSMAILRMMREKGLRITIGDDAHSPAHIGNYQRTAIETAKYAGFTSLWYMDSPQDWKEISIEELERLL